jgi:bacterial/archaeal transporter family-2 protein
MYLALSALTGGLILVQTMVNAELGNRRGTVFSSFVNYLVAAVFLAFCYFPARTFLQVQETGTIARFPAWSLVVPFMAVGITLSVNLVIPRMDAVRSTMMLFSGQIATGLLLDAATGMAMGPKTFLGLTLVIAGILLDGFGPGSGSRSP